MKAEIVIQTRPLGTNEKNEKREVLRKLTAPQTGGIHAFDEIGKEHVLGPRKLGNSVIESWIEFSDD